MDSLSDEELIRRWTQDGSQSAAQDLHARYIEKLLSRINSNIASDLRGKFSAESIANSAFGSFFRRTKEGAFKFDQDEAFWRLLVTIALNKLRERIRKKQPGSFTAAGIDADIAARGLVPTPDEVAAFRDLRERILGALNDRQREYLHRREQGLNQLEIAEELGVSDRQVRRYAREVEIRARILFGDEIHGDEESGDST